MIRSIYDPAVYPDAEGIVLECDLCPRRCLERLYMLSAGGCVCADCALHEEFTETHDTDDCAVCGEEFDTLYAINGKKYCVYCALEQLRSVDGEEEFLYG